MGAVDADAESLAEVVVSVLPLEPQALSTSAPVASSAALAAPRPFKPNFIRALQELLGCALSILNRFRITGES